MKLIKYIILFLVIVGCRSFSSDENTVDATALLILNSADDMIITCQKNRIDIDSSIVAMYHDSKNEEMVFLKATLPEFRILSRREKAIENIVEYAIEAAANVDDDILVARMIITRTDSSNWRIQKLDLEHWIGN